MAAIHAAQIVLEGTTETDGSIKLTDGGQKALQDAYCANPGRLWLMQPGHSARIKTARESAEWPPEERLRQLMSAADFSAKVHQHLHSNGLHEQLCYAKDQLAAPSSSALAAALTAKS